MPQYFLEPRNCELSLLFYLDTNLTADWPGTTVAKTWKQVYSKDVDLPIVLVHLADTASTRLEVGANTLENRHLLILNLFTRSHGQRLDMAYYIKNKLKDGWVSYLHSHASGDSSTLVRTVNGRDTVTDWIGDSVIDVGETTDDKDRFRHSLSIRVRHKDAP